MADFLYKGVVDWFLEQMSQGKLAPGDKMPSLRKLAKQLELSLNTVIHGYDLLAEEGWIESRPKSGYFVCHKPSVKHAHVLAGDKVVQFGEALSKKMPWSALSHRAAMVDQSDEFLIASVKQGESDLPILGKGHLAVREAVSEHLRKVAINVHPSHIWLGRSPLSMYTQAVQTLTDRGDAVLVITPCDPRLTSTLINLGREVFTLAAGERGVDLDEAVRCMRDDAIKLVVFPSQFAFPSGSEVSNLSLRRWLAILQHVAIPAIEWDMTSHLGYKSSTLMTYKSLDDKNQVVYIGGVESKGVDRNAAWCIPGQYTDLEGALLSADLALSDPQQQALMDALQSTQRQSLMRRARQIWSVAEKSKSILEGALGNTVRFASCKGGLTLWLQLDQALTDAQMTQLLAKHRHGIVPGYYLSAQNDADHWLAVNVTYDAIDKLALQLSRFVKASKVVDTIESDCAEALSQVETEPDMTDESSTAPQTSESETSGVLLEPSDFELDDVMLKEGETEIELDALQSVTDDSALVDDALPADVKSDAPPESESKEEKTSKTVYNPMLDLINHDFG